MTMENRRGIKITLKCSACGCDFQRPKNTLRKNQLKIFCSRDCMKDAPDIKRIKAREAKKKWNEKNREKFLAQKKNWRLKNIEKVRAWKKLDWEKHGHKRHLKEKLFRQQNPEIVRAKDRERYRENAEKVKAWAQAYRKANPHKIREYYENHRRNNRASCIWSRSRKSAKDAGIEFNLTKEWIQERLDAGICELSGIPFDINGKRTPLSPSVDQIKAMGGYTKDNCRLILWYINRALSNNGLEFMLDIFEKVKLHQADKARL